jgi:O-antigen/teichoic acid export membrane protein
MATTFFTFPLLVYLFFFAKSIIVVLYSSKWLPSVEFFRILCVGGVFNAIIHINRNVLKSVGETRRLFFTQIITTIIGLAGVAYFLRYDLKMLVIWIACTSFINGLFIGFSTGRKIGYNLLMQFKDMFPNFLFALMAGFISYYIGQFIANDILNALIGALIFAVVYFLPHFVLKTRQLQTVQNSNK